MSLCPVDPQADPVQRESRYVRVARLALHTAQQTLPLYRHRNSPHRFTVPQLTACVLLAFYLKLSYRDLEEWRLASQEVRHTLGLTQVPDHTTLYRAYARLRQADWHALHQTLLAGLKVQGSESLVAVDSTGFRFDQASVYYQTRSGQRRQRFLKGAFVVGTHSQFVLAVQARLGFCSDARLLKSLRKRCARYRTRPRTHQHQRPSQLLADAGFDGRAVQPEAGDLIPPIRRSGGRMSEARQRRWQAVERAKSEGVYGQRWKCETVHSVIKRRFGEGVRSREGWRQRREVSVKALVYNLHR